MPRDEMGVWADHRLTIEEIERVLGFRDILGLLPRDVEILEAELKRLRDARDVTAMLWPTTGGW